MTRFYFNLRNGGRLLSDAEGEEVAVGDLQVFAQQNARDILRTSGMSVRSWMDMSYEITCAAGDVVLAVPFSEALDTDLL
ncbi:MAG: hypothetical protein JWL62_528 [Hyphomicrobiales bacterium]|nr:hypothetical protein [Hyphomicrobiales bacterium]